MTSMIAMMLQIMKARKDKEKRIARQSGKKIEKPDRSAPKPRNRSTKFGGEKSKTKLGSVTQKFQKGKAKKGGRK